MVRQKKSFYVQYQFFLRKSLLLWDNVEKYGVSEYATYNSIMRRMHFAWRITKTTDTRRICTTAFLQQQCFRERDSASRYTCIACLVFYHIHLQRIQKFGTHLRALKYIFLSDLEWCHSLRFLKIMFYLSLSTYATHLIFLIRSVRITFIFLMRFPVSPGWLFTLDSHHLYFVLHGS
jgi:hypothetical protein